MKECFWIDSHFHPQIDPLKIDSIKEAYDHGVKKLCCVATSLNDLDFLLKCKELGPKISLGEHPLNDHSLSVDWKVLENNIDKINAVGECGFDFQGDLSEQLRVFDIQASIASSAKLPIILHIRDSGDGVVEELIIKSLKKYPMLQCIFHCFTGSLNLAKFAVDNGHYVSFSGIVTFKNANNVRDALKVIPKDLLLIETDAPYLAPVPVRSKSNHPIFVKYIGEFISDFLNIDLDSLKFALMKNFDTVFK